MNDLTISLPFLVVHHTWEELEDVNISLLQEDAGQGELLLMKLVIFLFLFFYLSSST